ncbi:MAG: MFS transporter [Sphingomonadaceae bacterium]|nr:MFS transporter [Sphingomonadaceae bacterium]
MTALPRRDFALLFAVLLTVAAGNTALQSVLPSIARTIGIRPTLVAVVFSLSALLWTVSAPYWARQSDTRGRKRLMLTGVAGFAVSMTGCAVSILLGLRGALGATAVFLSFTALRSLFGLFGSASNPAAQAYVAARTDAHERTRALATLTSAFGLGTILGPGVAPFFEIRALGLSAPMFAFAAIAVAVGTALLLWLPDDDPTHERTTLPHGAPASMPSIAASATGGSARAAAVGRRPPLRFRDPRVWPFMVYGFITGSVQAATGQALGFLVIDAVGGSPAAAAKWVGIVLMVGAGATLFAQWGLIRVLNPTASALMRWGAALAAAGLTSIALAHGFTGIVAAYALTSLGYGFARPGFVAGASLMVGEAEQGAVAGAVTSVNGACFIVAPTIGIGLYEMGGSYPYWLGAAVQLVLLGYALFDPVLRRELGAAPAD